MTGGNGLHWRSRRCKGEIDKRGPVEQMDAQPVRENKVGLLALDELEL
jgi:hypothetical protein